MSHSSLSTPTPGISQTTSSPPRAPPTPPDSDSGPRPSELALAAHPTTVSSPSASVVSSLSEQSPELSDAPSSYCSAPTSSLLDSSSPDPNLEASSFPLSSTNSVSSNQRSARSNTPSPSSSRFQSPYTSPQKFRTRNVPDEDGEMDDSESSDVEIYLSMNSIAIDDSASRIHALAAGGQVADESPVLPPVSQFPQRLSTNVTITASPQMPRAPVQQTIPLPDVDNTAYKPPSHSSHVLTVHSQIFEPRSHIQIHKVNPENVYTLDSNSNTSQPGCSIQKDSDASQKTPNVYINGLPPHFPEDQLFALAAPFGDIRSVRTFTRHVRDSESGYGFVLFETIDAAERCILSLRRYRNLHPTFSKQVHKIPGTNYAHLGTVQTPPSSTTSSLAGWEQEDHDIGAEASFKAKMESLHDLTSTNLYMEGLPLSIDEPTLSALVSPHRIISSRFFQTRLSNPPRIIAFVRLETRAGAEEIIERLHGRMVRGWNDTGSRISVRFADTAEQRELRRTERIVAEGEPSPARLTIAQAALINLRGQDLRTKTGPVIHTHSIPTSGASYERRPARGAQILDFQTNAADHFAVDYTLAPGRGHVSQRAHSPSPASMYQNYTAPALHPLHRSLQPVIDPNMAILDSIRDNGGAYRGNSNAYIPREPDYAHGHSYLQDNRHLAMDHNGHVLDDVAYLRRQPGPAQARSGYTATEEYIIRAHAESNAMRRRPAPLELAARRRRDGDASANIGMGVRGYRTQASVSLLRTQPDAEMSPAMGGAPLPMMSEDEFHAAAARNDFGGQSRRVEQESGRAGGSHGVQHVHARISRESGLGGDSPSIQQQSQQHQSVSTLSPQLSHDQHYQHAHLRSTTLPQRSSSNQHQHRHYQHSSMSIPKSNGLRTPQLGSNSIMNKNTHIYDDDHHQQHLHQQQHVESTLIKNSNNNNNNRVTKSSGNISYEPKALYRQRPAGANYQDPAHIYDIDQASPSLISPTLTYSSQTPSTLSPATPFFGSFGNTGEGFERVLQAGPEEKMSRPGSR